METTTLKFQRWTLRHVALNIKLSICKRKFYKNKHQMSKIHNNCFGSKVGNMILHQAKIGDHDYSKIATMLKAVLFN